MPVAIGSQPISPAARRTLSPAAPPVSDPKDIVTLQIIHTNDIHGHLEHLSNLDSVIHDQMAKYPNSTLVMDAGDQVHGDAAGDLDNGMPMMTLMNQMGYTDMTIGNHNLQWGLDSLKQWTAAARSPILLANVTETDGTPLPNTQPYRIETVGGIKVGVLGLLTSDTQNDSDETAGLKFLDEEQMISKYLPQMKAEGAQVITLLTHVGKKESEQLAAENAGQGYYDIGGHSHDAIDEPDVVGGNVIVQAGSYNQDVGVLQIDYDTKLHRAVAVRHQLIAINPATQPADAGIEAQAQVYEKKAAAKLSEVVAQLPAPLTRSGQHDSTLGNLITDSMREAAKADIALTNSDGIRSDVAAGNVTLEALYNVMPFGGELQVGTLAGQDLAAALENSIDQRPATDTWHAPFLQASGLTMSYDASRPQGSRVTDVMVNGQPLDPARSYKVALEDYLVKGKLGYTSFLNGRFHETGTGIIESVEAHLRSHAGGVSFDTGRIKDNTPAAV